MLLTADTGIPKINRLLASAAEPALPAADGPPEAVGIVHDLLLGFDPLLKQLRPHLPAPRKTWKAPPLPSRDAYGVYSANTTALVKAFQTLRALPVTGQVDHATLVALVAAKRPKTLITPAQLIFDLGFTYSAFLKATVLTGGKECRFDFTVMNRNTDGAGLSLGVLHWAQKPGRLYEAIVFVRSKNKEVVDALFGGETEMDRVVAQLKLGAKGLDAKGWSNDITLEFARPSLVVARYWPDCFRRLLTLPFVQKALVEFAMKTFRKLYDNTYADYPGDPSNLLGGNLKGYATKLVSERAIVFALDMINQHASAVKKYYTAILADNPAATEKQILEGLKAKAADFWLSQTKPTPEARQKNAQADSGRRDFFLNTHQLSETAFDPT